MGLFIREQCAFCRFELTSDGAGWSRPVASWLVAHRHRRFGTTMKGPAHRSVLEATACRFGTEKWQEATS